MNILFFKPIPRPAIWGHTLVKDYFGYDDFPDGIGQSWSFSAQKDASTVCISEPFQGKTLLDLWENHQELFGCEGEPFPVIISLVAPEDDLSIQVHPQADYAKQKGFSTGKNEAWYFIEAKEGANIVYGHHAKNEAELKQYIKEDRWDDLIHHLDVHQGDFVYLPAGLIHALRKGSIVYEIQQATDITYRFYDYHRKDANGNERELHVQQSIDVSTVPYQPYSLANQEVSDLQNGTATKLVSSEFFTLTKYEMNGENTINNDKPFQMVTVIKGNGTIDGNDVKMGDNFVVCSDQDAVVYDGNMTVMICTL